MQGIMSQKDSFRANESISVREFYERFKDRFQLEVICGHEGLDRVVREKSLNRPALALIGHFRHFASKRIQLFGAGEMAYLRDIPAATQYEVLSAMAQKNIPCMIVSRNLAPTKEMVRAAQDAQVPLIRTPCKSKDFTAEVTLLLEDYFAPRFCLHGTLLDVKGIGLLLQGRSGVGKSECALALIERGHSLVADDLTYCKLVKENELIGTSSELSRGYMECRGIGILNIAELFGIRSIRTEKRLDLVVDFIEWQPGMPEERTGLDRKFYEVMGVQIPHVEIPLRPGRDMARLVEVACMVEALRQIGHDSAGGFNKRLIAYMNNPEKEA